MNKVHQKEISTDVDWLLGRLQLLKQGIPVALQINRERATGKRKNPVMVITPTQYFGGPPNSFVVSVLENGSTIVIAGTKRTGNLVMAGVPAKLAAALMSALHKLYEEENHASTSTPPQRSTRPSSPARRRST